MTEPFASFAAYILVCTSGLLFGCAILSFIGTGLPSNVRHGIAPLVSTAIWSVALALAMAAGLTVRKASLIVWIMTLIGCGLGIAKGAHKQLPPAWIFGLCFILPIAVLAPAFFTGLTDYQISVAPDGWAYVATGQYAWEFPLTGQHGHNAPLYQYAMKLLGTRFVAMSMLGLFSRLFIPGDTQMASGLLLAYALFVLGLSCAAFASSIRLKGFWIALFVILVVSSGWISNMILVSNWDHLLALPYLPASLAILNASNCSQRRCALLLGGLIAALLITYVEGAVFVLFGLGLVGLWRVILEHQKWKSWLYFAGCSLSITCLLLIPHVHRIAAFFLNQVSAASPSSNRPGEGLFPGLLSKGFPVAFWGLGPEWGMAGDHQRLFVIALAAAVLSVLAFAGFVRMLLSGRLDLVAISGLLFVGVIFMLDSRHYSYGAYKMITFAWLFLVAAIVLGIAGASRVKQWRAGWTLSIAGLIACTCLIAPLRTFSLQPSIPAAYCASLPMKEFRSLEQIRQITGGAPVLVAVDDWVANEWAVYYLRKEPIYLATYRMYMDSADSSPYLNAAAKPDLGQVKFMLTDSQTPLAQFNHAADWRIVYSSGAYRLWKSAAQDWVVITDVSNGNGLETFGGKPFFWMGNGQTVFTLVANHGGQVGLRGEVVLGPSLPPTPQHAVRIETSAGYQNKVFLGAGSFSLRIPVMAGKNIVRMTSLDQPISRPQPNGDTRPLLLGICDVRVRLDQLGARVISHQVINGNGLEKEPGLFWIGNGNTVITLYTETPGTAMLQAQFIPGPSIPQGTERRLRVSSDSGYAGEVVIRNADDAILVPVQSGENRIVLTPLDKPTVRVLPNGDPRPLILGVRGLRIVTLESSEPSRPGRGIMQDLSVSLKGFGSVDLVSMSETPGADGQADAVLQLEVRRPGRVRSLGLRNTDGLYSVWDTVPGNGHVLLGVAEAGRPGVLLNRPDGSVDLEVEGSRSLLLYAADNSSIRGGQTHYQLNLTFGDGSLERIPLKPNR
jgi:hypothetical protein